MNSKIIMRPAERGDTPALRTIAEAAGLFPPDMLDDMIAGYLERTRPDIWFVADNQECAVAFGFSEPERMTSGTWNLLAIGVIPDHQGRGIGTQMMRYIEGRLRARGERILLAETMGTPEFERTRSFYRANGYTEEARIREFYEAGADKIVFWKHL